jgi:hypothetical protein
MRPDILKDIGKSLVKSWIDWHGLNDIDKFNVSVESMNLTDNEDDLVIIQDGMFEEIESLKVYINETRIRK